MKSFKKIIVDNCLHCVVDCNTLIAYDSYAGRYVFTFGLYKIFVGCYFENLTQGDILTLLVNSLDRFSKLYKEEMAANMIFESNDINNNVNRYNIESTHYAQRCIAFRDGEIAIFRAAAINISNEEIIWVLCYAKGANDFVNLTVIPFIESLRYDDHQS
jgi:hypothetical protein